jgi:site-specific DNA-methyltransferase (adenine-specific)
VSFPVQYQNQIVVADALDFLRSLPDACVSLFLFSPPYNLGNNDGSWLPGACRTGHYAAAAGLGSRGGKAGMGGKGGKWNGGGLAQGYDDYGDNLPWPEYIAWQHAILRECWRCLTAGGAIFYNHKPRVLENVFLDPIRFIPDGLPIRQRVIWARAGGVNFNPGYYVPTHEYIYVIAKSGFRLKSQGASGVGDVWVVPQISGTWHPAPFPLTLAERVIETVMPALVVDPFIGSGTTAAAARRYGIAYSGCDRNAAYVEKAKRWVEELQPYDPTLIGVQEKLL